MGSLLKSHRRFVLFLAIAAVARAQTPTTNEGPRQAFAQSTYSLTDSGHGTWRGENATQRFTLEFTDRDAHLKHPQGSVTFHLTGSGYGDRLREPARAKLAGTGNRVEYRREDLTEWYINGSQGLEQGFTLAQRPSAKSGGQPLVIALAVTGDLVPSQSADKNSVQFASGDDVVLRYEGLKATDARGRVIPSRMELRAGEIRLIVEDRDAKYPLAIDPAWTQMAKLSAPDGIIGDTFGESVSVSGNTAVVGAPHAANNRGAAYVFVNNGAGWVLQQELTASNGKGSDGFGYSVAVSGDVALIGANGITQSSGAAYVFIRSGGVWTQQQELGASDAQAGDKLGSSVALNGAAALIGAPAKTVGSNQLQGTAYVFTSSGGVWSQSAELTASDGAAGDRFGSAVSASGNLALIGAPYRNSAQGAAYVFSGSGTAWSEVLNFVAPDGLPSDYLGSAVSINGNLAIVGSERTAAPGFAYLGTSVAGVFTQWVELEASDGVTGDIFGASVAVSGNTAVVGAPFKNSSQGAVYTFINGVGSGIQQQELTASDGSAGDHFGTSVSAAGSTIVAGASNKTSQQGEAYAFASASLGTSSLVFGSAAGTSTVELSAAGSWTAAANDSFLHISPESSNGTGKALIVFTYDNFAGPQSRTGTLTIAGLTLTVTQAGPECLGPSGSIALVSPGLNSVGGLALDLSGNVYIANTGAATIMQWNATTQQVATIVSSGLASPAAVAVDGAGNIYIADAGDNAIEEWNAASRQLATLLSSGLSGPSSVAVDPAGNVYIADTGNNAIKEWSPSTQHVTTLVSTGLSSPSGVAVDLLGNVYFSDSGNNAIKEWDSSTQEVTTLASAVLGQPSGVAVDGSGNVYFTTPTGVEEWSAANQQVAALGFGGGPGLAVDDSGNVYGAGTNRIVEQSNSFVGPATQSPALGAEASAFVIPATSLSGVFSPTIQSNNPYPHGVSIAGTYNQSTSLSVIGLYIGVSWSYKVQPATLTVLGRTIVINQPASQLPVITMTHQGNFVQGQQGAQYTIKLSPPPGGLSFDPPYISLVDNLPPGLTLVSIVSASGDPNGYWSCSGSACSNGFFANGPTLPAFTVTVNVAMNAPSIVTNEATLSAVDGSATASDPTTIVAGGPLAILTTSVPVANQYQSYSTALTAAGGLPPYTWSVVSSTGVSLPEGISLDPSTGIVSAAQVNGQGGYAVTVQVSDSTSPIPNVTTATLKFGVNSDGTYGGCQMFPPDSIFHQRIDALPVDNNPSHQIPTAYLASPLHPDFGGGFYPYPGGIPFLRVPANQVSANVNLAGAGQIDAAGTYQWPFPAWPNLPTEGTSYGLNGNSYHFLILQSSVNNLTGPQAGACTLYEANGGSAVASMYDSGSNTWSPGAGAHYVLNSDELAASEATLDTGAQDSTGIPIVPLLIKYNEVPLGVQHPLRMTFPSPTAGFVWPATGCCAGSGPPEGLLYRLKAGVNWQAVCPVGTNPQAATVLQALQQYGAYMSDHANAGFIQGVPDVRWNDSDLACIQNFPLTDLEVVNNGALEVSDISGQTQPYVAPATLADGTLGTDYSAAIVETGGDPATLQWSVSSGSLPLGLTLNASTGAIGGTPTSTSGNPYAFGITVMDTASGHASQEQLFAIQVPLESQTITFGTLSNAALNTGPVPIGAISASGLAVSFSSQTTGICTVLGATVTLVAVGTCTIQATQAGNTNWSAATPANQSFQVTQGSQTITFGTLSSAELNTGGTLQNAALNTGPFTMGAISTSNLPVSLHSLTTAICTISGTTVTPVAVGTCTIQATQAGNTNWAAATPVTKSVQVMPGSQTINFGTLSNTVLGTGPSTVGATATSNLAVSFNSQTVGVCTVSGTTVTLVAVGTCTVQATQTGNTNWAAATPVNRSLQVMAPACDLRQNGNISATDVQLIVNQALGVRPPTNDLTGDGAIDIADVQIQINAALGLGCATH